MRNRTLLILLAALSILLLVTVALAAPDTLRLPWWTADGGGGQSTGGDFTLRGTIGQPDGGQLQGGQYRLSSGFWGGPLTEPPPEYLIFLPVASR
jgi:hypothetical protein